jgi:hypothetical protein
VLGNTFLGPRRPKQDLKLQGREGREQTPAFVFGPQFHTSWFFSCLSLTVPCKVGGPVERQIHLKTKLNVKIFKAAGQGKTGRLRKF